MKLFQKSGASFIMITLCLVSVILLSGCLEESYSMAGKEMEPSLKAREWYKVMPYNDKSIKRWEIVRLREPKQLREQYRVLRVVGLPGDELKLNFYGIWINGELQKNQYPGISYVFKGDGVAVNDSLEIPQGMYFVLGDNYRISRDSRHFGFVSKEEIEGHIQRM